MLVAINGSSTNLTFPSFAKPRLSGDAQTLLWTSTPSESRENTKSSGNLTSATSPLKHAPTDAASISINASTTSHLYINQSNGVITDAPPTAPSGSSAWWSNYTEQTTIIWSERASQCSAIQPYQSDPDLQWRSLGKLADEALRCNSTMNLDYGNCFVAWWLWLENEEALFDLQMSSYESASSTFKPIIQTFSPEPWSYTQYTTSTFEINGQRYGYVSSDKVLSGTYPPWTRTALAPDLVPAPSSVQPRKWTCTTGCGACTIQNVDMTYLSQVRLLYWPPATTASGMLIGTPYEGAPRSVMINDTTYVSPSVYISFSSLSAINSCGVVGRRYTDILITLTDAAELSSFSFYLQSSTMTWTDLQSSVKTLDLGGILSLTAKAFNYADLEWPYNPQAYSGQQKCVKWGDTWPEYCSIITQPYTPILVIPSQVKEIDPLWATCDYYPIGVEDPPYALTPVDAPTMAQTLAPAKPTPMSLAKPALTAQPQLATQTAASPSHAKQTQAEPPGSAQGSPSISNTYKAPTMSQIWPMPDIVFTIEAHEYTVLSKGVVCDDATTIRAGDPAVSNHDRIISVAPEGKILAGWPNHVSLVGDAGDPGNPNWTPTPTTWVHPSPTMDVGGVIFTRIAESAYLAGDQILSYGESAIISETMVYLDSSGAAMMIGKRLIGLDPARGRSRMAPSTYNALSESPLPRCITINGATFVPDAQGVYSMYGQILLPGGTITNAGTPIVLASDGASLRIGQSVQTLKAAPILSPYLTIGGRVYSADPQGDLLLDGTTLSRGSHITVSGTVLSLAVDGAFAAAGTSTIALLPTPGPSRHLQFKGITYTADIRSEFTINGQLLAPGGKITISGTAVSLATDGVSAIIGTSTQMLDPTMTPPPTVTVNGKIYTENPKGLFVIDGQTLSPGGTVTISGTVLSLADDGLSIVVDGSTQSIATQISGDPSIGGLIFSGLGGPLPTDGVFYEGTASRVELRFWSSASLTWVSLIAMFYVLIT